VAYGLRVTSCGLAAGGVKRKIGWWGKWGLQFFGKIVRFRVLMQKLVIGLDVGGLRVAAYGRRTGD
jgi:hypothetical protein